MKYEPEFKAGESSVNGMRYGEQDGHRKGNT